MLKTIKQPLASLVGVAGQPVTAELSGGVYHRRIQLRSSCSIQVSVANATNVRNKGSSWGIWDFIKITGGGDGDRVSLDGRSLRAISEAMAPSALSATRLTTPNVGGPTPLAESGMIFLAYPTDADPHATAYRRKQDNKKLFLTAQLRADGGGGGLVTPGGATVAVTVPTIAAEEVYDDMTSILPDFVTLIRQDVVKVAANGPQQPYYLTTANAIRGILIQQDTDQGEVGDILVSLALRYQGRDLIGPAQVPIDDLLRAQEYDFGGAVYATGLGPSATGAAIGSYLFIYFAENGRLSNMVPGTAYSLRIEYTANTSGQAGVTQSNLRFTFIEEERDLARCKAKLAYSI